MKTLTVNVNKAGLRFIKEQLEKHYKLGGNNRSTLLAYASEAEDNYMKWGSTYFEINGADTHDGRHHEVYLPEECYDVTRKDGE